MRIDVLQHVSFEGPGAIAAWAHERGYRLRSVRLDQGQAVPGAGDSDALVVMGGPMGAHDEGSHPWLAAEKRLIAQTIGSSGRVLGICLGAQLIAAALGARVFRNAEKEIGWWPVEWSAAGAAQLLDGRPLRMTVFHWHGDTFDLPQGAVHLARSAACANQAFAIGERVLGLQFHIEVTPESVRALVQNGAADLARAPYVQTAEAILNETGHYQELNTLLFEVLDRWMQSRT
jgi:GMP synthase-like glutamine amidotransferase